MGQEVYVGAEVIVSPLGESASTNFKAVLAGNSGIRLHREAGWKGSDVYLSRFESAEAGSFRTILKRILTALSDAWDARLLASPDTLVILSSTKGDLPGDIRNPFQGPLTELVAGYTLANPPMVISNACISGVLAINCAARMVKAGHYRHVVVLGCDVVSDFVLYGFQSLYAVSEGPCRPFDLDRSGVSLGEGGGAVVVSSEMSAFRQRPARFLAGADANDANHISGPSRTGEGLVRAVSAAIRKSAIPKSEIGFINAHGTGTKFNDEMEAIAFDRMRLEATPLNSSKGYWGHTLGAAGVIETAACLQSLRNGIVPASKGFENPGTSKNLHILTKNTAPESGTFLKTASGFGGGNAALIIQSL